MFATSESYIKDDHCCPDDIINVLFYFFVKEGEVLPKTFSNI